MEIFGALICIDRNSLYLYEFIPLDDSGCCQLLSIVLSGEDPLQHFSLQVPWALQRATWISIKTSKALTAKWMIPWNDYDLLWIIRCVSEPLYIVMKDLPYLRPLSLTDNNVPSARLYSKVTPKVKSISRLRKLLVSLTWNVFPSCAMVIFRLSWAASFLFTMLIPNSRHVQQDSEQFMEVCQGFFSLCTHLCSSFVCLQGRVKYKHHTSNMFIQLFCYQVLRKTLTPVFGCLLIKCLKS